jgi:quercetin dioxygenase-like cupin family protein
MDNLIDEIDNPVYRIGMIHVLRVDEQRQFETPGGNTTTPLGGGPAGGGKLLVVRQRQEPGGHNPLHRKSVDSTVVVLEGTIAVGTSTEGAALGAGDSCVVPAGELHQIRNVGDTAAMWIVATTVDVRFSAQDGAPVEPVWAS